MCDNLSDSNAKVALKFMKKIEMKQQISVALSETQLRAQRGGLSCRGNLNIIENISVCGTHPVNFAMGERLFFKGTSCQTNFIVNADVPQTDQLTKVRNDVKQAIIGPNKLSKCESVLANDDEVILFHHEKDPKLWQELWKQLSATRVITFNSGSGLIAESLLKYDGLKSWLLVFNEAQRKVVHGNIMTFLMNESKKPRNKFSLDRKSIIDKLGLPPDENVNVPAPFLPQLPKPAPGPDSGPGAPSHVTGEADDGSAPAGHTGAPSHVPSEADDDAVPSSPAEDEMDGEALSGKGDEEGEEEEQEEEEVAVRPPPMKRAKKSKAGKKGDGVDGDGTEGLVKKGRGKGRGRGRGRKSIGAAQPGIDDDANALDAALFGSKPVPIKRQGSQAKP